jgi:hypothetical protein
VDVLQVHGCNIKVLLFWFGPELAASWPVLLGGQAQWTVGLLATIISISTIIAADTGAFLGGRVCSFWSPPVPIPNSSQRSVEFRDHLLLPFHLLWFRCGHMVIFVSFCWHSVSIFLSILKAKHWTYFMLINVWCIQWAQVNLLCQGNLFPYRPT